MSQNDLKHVGARVLIYEYKKSLEKIKFYQDKIIELAEDNKKIESKRLKAPLKLYETYKANIEEEANRRNMPLDELTGIKE